LARRQTGQRVNRRAFVGNQAISGPARGECERHAPGLTIPLTRSAWPQSKIETIRGENPPA